MPSVRSQTGYYPGGHCWFEKHKKTAGKQEGDVANPTSLLPLPMVGITERFYDSATLETLLRPSITVDFDTGAEADLVDRVLQSGMP